MTKILTRDVYNTLDGQTSKKSWKILPDSRPTFFFVKSFTHVLTNNLQIFIWINTYTWINQLWGLFNNAPYNIFFDLELSFVNDLEYNALQYFRFGLLNINRDFPHNMPLSTQIKGLIKFTQPIPCKYSSHTQVYVWNLFKKCGTAD